MANNSSGARSVLYGKTIDHVLEQHVVLSDGSLAHFRPLDRGRARRRCARGDSLEARVLSRGAAPGARARRRDRAPVSEGAAPRRRLQPRRVRRPGRAVQPGEADGRLRRHARRRRSKRSSRWCRCRRPRRCSRSSSPTCSRRSRRRRRSCAPSVGGRGDGPVHPRPHAGRAPALERLRQHASSTAIPAALLCVEFYADRAEDLPPRLEALERDLAARGFGYRYHRALDPAAQARIWSLREAALGLSMAMKGDAKSLSFVEDTAVAPEKLRDYIERFLAIVRRARHDGRRLRARVGRLPARAAGRQPEDRGGRPDSSRRSPTTVADLVLEFGGALSGEHGDGLVRSPFMREDVRAGALRGVPAHQAHVRSATASSTPARSSTRRRSPPICATAPAIATPQPATFFDYADYGGMAGAVEMCSGLGACRKTLDGTMCPSYMATRDEAHSTRGRANVLRLAMAGRLGEAGLGDEGVQRGARSVPRVPRLQGRVPGRRRRRAVQERVPRRLLDAARHAAPRARARPRPRRVALGQPARAAVELRSRGARRCAG